MTNKNRSNTPYVVFQPIIGAEDGRVKGYEALGRGRTPEGLLISPADVLRGMDVHSRVAFDYAIAELALSGFATRTHAYRDCWVSINAGRETLQDAGYAPHLIHLAERYGIACRQIVTEVLEECTLFFTDSQIMRTVGMLARAGFIIAVDDFPHWDQADTLLRWLYSRNADDRVIGEMKLDKSLIDEVAMGGHTEEARDLICSAHKHGMYVVAEGIETLDQAHMLQDFGVDLFQGYLYGKPCDKEGCFAHA